METIIESIINGQRKQALNQLKESYYNLADLFEALQDQEMNKEVITLTNILINNEMITEKEL